MTIKTSSSQNSVKALLTFFAITVFYFFESAQMSYFNVLAPHFLSTGIYHQSQIASLSAAYYYGDMLGLLPVGVFLDRFALRKILLWAILGSIIGAFLLISSNNFYIEWAARFICGFFGGTFSFVGGIRVLANLFPHRFTFFMSIFLSAGMFAGLICQYPLLLVANHLGVQGTMAVMASFGIVVGIVNFLYLHPQHISTHQDNRYPGSTLQMCLEIIKNLRNWLDCLMIVLLDTPVSIIGTLWGIVLLMGFYHFSPELSAWIVMSSFAGLMLGLPILGALADRYHYPAWIIIWGSSLSFLSIVMMLVFQHSSPWVIALFFFLLGFLSSCQTLGFTWLTKNMRPELIGRNSAFNSMIFMGANGVFKQMGAALLGMSPLLPNITNTPAGNLLILIASGMLLSAIYAYFRKKIFNTVI